MLSNTLGETLRHFIRAAIADGIEAKVKPSEAEIAHRVELFVQGTHPALQKRFRYLLMALWGAPVVFCFKTFPQLLPDQQHRLLDRWASSRFYYLWFSFDVLKSLCMMVYYSDPDMESQVEYRRPCGAGRGSSLR